MLSGRKKGKGHHGYTVPKGTFNGPQKIEDVFVDLTRTRRSVGSVWDLDSRGHKSQWGVTVRRKITPVIHLPSRTRPLVLVVPRVKEGGVIKTTGPDQTQKPRSLGLSREKSNRPVTDPTYGSRSHSILRCTELYSITDFGSLPWFRRTFKIL